MWRSFPSQLDGGLLQRALGAAIGLMNVAQAEAIAKTILGLRHVVLWRGLISLSRDIPSSDIDLLASRNRLLVQGSSPRLAVSAAGSDAQSPLDSWVSFRPSSPMICLSLQW